MIVPLKKATLIVPERAGPQLLTSLQSMGIMHLEDLSGRGIRTRGVGPAGDALRALQFLQDAPHKRPQLHHDRAFDADAFIVKVLQLQHDLKARIDEREKLRQRIREVRPWGNFVLPNLEKLGGLRIWFYKVPVNRFSMLQRSSLQFKQVNKDNKFHYVLIVAKHKPHHFPFIRSHVGTVPLEGLEAQRESLENLIEDLETDRIRMTRYVDALKASMQSLDDRAKYEQAHAMGWEAKGLRLYQGWLAAEAVPQLQALCRTHGWVLRLSDPRPDELPPTLIRNRPETAFGKSLLTFYTTPPYWQSDPSPIFFASFALFFAIILGDAGYAVVLGLIALLYRKRLSSSEDGRAFAMLLKVLTLLTFVWGVLIGSYFGLTPPSGSPGDLLHLLDVNDYDAMMRLSITIGALHLMLANAVRARDRYRLGVRGEAFAAAGWAVAVFGALLLYLIAPQIPGIVLSTVGLMAVVLFSGTDRGWRRLLGGLFSLTRITSIFGDVLSYLRLFALGLATSAMAVAFNQLAAGVMEQMPGVGILMALLILLIGHTLNFVLGIMSGVVHGLRLNVIEYLNWNAQGEGYPFEVFDRHSA